MPLTKRDERYIKSALRKIWRWSEQRRLAYEKAKVSKDQYRCAECKEVFSRKKKQLAVDHINPVVNPKSGFIGFEDYLNKLFCDVSGLQVLCKKTCHAAKTKAENKLRRKKKD